MKKVKISYEWWNAIIEVDETPETLKYMKEQLMFWSRGEDRISCEGGDIFSAYLKMLGEEMIPKTMQLNVNGIMEYFLEAEGWSPLDGSFGIRLVSVDSWEFEPDEFVVCEIQ